MTQIKLFSNFEGKSPSLSFEAQPKQVSMYINDTFIFNRLLINDMAVKLHPGAYTHHIGMNPIDMNRLKNISCIDIDEPVLCMIFRFDDNYSHFTAQCVGTYLLAAKLGLIAPKMKIICPVDKPFQREHLLHLGININNMIPLNKFGLYRFKYLIYSDLNISQKYVADPSIVELFEDYGKTFGTGSIDKLYISRNSSTKRKCLNESCVIDFCTTRGFTVVDFDKVSVADQIAFVKGAHTICAAHGASGINLIYKSKENFRFIEYYASSRVDPTHVSILASKNCTYSGTMNRAVDEQAKNGSDCDFYIDMNILQEAFQKTSFAFRYKLDHFKCESIGQNLFNLLKPFMTDMVMLFFEIRQLEEQGLGKEALLKLMNVPINDMDRRVINIYYKLAFLFGDQVIFYRIHNILLNHILLNWNMLFSYAIKRSDYNTIKDVLNASEQISPNKEFISRCYSAKYISSLSTNVIFTWHHTIFNLNPYWNRLVHGTFSSTFIKITTLSDGIQFYIPPLDKYIDHIDKNGCVTFAENPFTFMIERYNDWNFSIYTGEGYLTSKLDGTVTTQRHPKEWERYFIKA